LGLFLVVACLVLPRRYFVQLTPEGLTLQYLTSCRRYSWAEVRNFRVAEGATVNSLPMGRKVVFDLAPRSRQRTTIVRVAAGINRYDVSILATFTISAEELATVLNEWQQLYGQAEPTAG
jgi:hypothetical protein